MGKEMQNNKRDQAKEDKLIPTLYFANVRSEEIGKGIIPVCPGLKTSAVRFN